MMFNFSIQKQKTPAVFKTLPLWDVLIIGGGPAGLNAALYAQRKGLHVGVISKEIGGQLHNTSTVDNYLGLPMLEGKDLSEAFLKHIQALDVPVYTDVWVNDIQKLNHDFVLMLSDGTQLKSKTVLYATGGKPRQLGIPGEEQFANKGVSYCTTCDAPFFKGKHVIVAGGGNSAAEAVIDLAPFASHITVVHRSQWRADPITLKKHDSIKHLTVHLETQLLEVLGDDLMTGVKILNKKTNKTTTLQADGLFVEIGLIPTSDGIAHLAELNDRKEVIIDEHFMTHIPGLFAAGDVTNVPFKQIVIAVGDGAKAALSIQHYLIHQYSKGE
jgi:NADH-dependent peroxiredoxin subunit F